VGLTGGIGSGKSTVAKAFKELGVEVVDADQASREVVKPGSKALKAIYKHFSKTSPDILQSDGQLNRAVLRDIIFKDSEQKVWLEELLHPLIGEWLLEQLAIPSDQPYSILESPLLLETNQHLMVDTILLIDVPPEVQLERASSRDATGIENIQAIIDTQMDRQEKYQKSNCVFDNTLPIDSIASRVLELHQSFLDQALSTKVN
jgi:dephospho-CoA kinase